MPKGKTVQKNSRDCHIAEKSAVYNTRNSFQRKTQIDEFFGSKQFKGQLCKPSAQQKNNSPHLYYEHPNGKLYLGDCIELMKGFPGESIDLVFADPPYNVPVALIQGRGKIRHRDFLEGSGELSPQQYIRAVATV